MRQMLKKLISAESIKIITFLGCAIFTICFTQIDTNHTAFAQNQNQTQTQDASNQTPTGASVDTATAIQNQNSILATYDETLQSVSSLLTFVVRAFNYLLWPILFLIGGLMDNSLIFGPGVEDRLYLIWSQIRNLINLLFAVVLIGVAIYNVLGLSKDGNYSLKTFLPSMVVTLVLVNFSFFGVRLALDAANVATTAVFALPNAVEQQFSPERRQTIEEGLCNNEAIKDIQDATNSTNAANLTEATTRICNGTIFSENGLAQFQSLDKNNMALVMAISFNRVADILEPSQLTISNPSLINLAINLLIVILLQIAYISGFFALFAVLVARVIAMWIVTIASPLLVLKIGMSKANIPGMSFLDSIDLEKMFVKHATAPIKIGLAMSVGYMMLDVFQSVGSPSLYFPLGDDFSNVFSGVSSINELFVAAVAIAIVWKVSFDAADDTFASSITNKYRSWAQGLGLQVRDLLIQRTPIIPQASSKEGGGKALSLGQIGKAPSKLISDAGEKFDKVTGNSKANSITARNLQSQPGRVLTDADSSKITNLSKKETRILANGIMASDDPAYKNAFDSANKAQITRGLEQIRRREVLQKNDYNGLDALIKEIKESKEEDMSNSQALERAREFLRKDSEKPVYRKADYDKDYKRINSDDNE